MTKSTHTHKGNCQACGRTQAIDNTTGLLAKHGYNVKFHYFAGVCPGAAHQPLQIDRTLTNQVIGSMLESARVNKVMLRKLKAGKTHPTTVDKFDETGRRITVKNPKTSMYETVPVLWSEANKHARIAGMEAAIWETEGNIRFCESHAKDMTALAARIHGTAVIPNVKEVIVKPAAPVVDVKAAKVEGTFPTKQARKDALDKLNRLYEKQRTALQNLYLAIPMEERSGPRALMSQMQLLQSSVYYGPMSLCHWRPKHSTQALKAFPESAAIVAEIEQLVKARQAVQEAP